MSRNAQSQGSANSFGQRHLKVIEQQDVPAEHHDEATDCSPEQTADEELAATAQAFQNGCVPAGDGRGVG